MTMNYKIIFSLLLLPWLFLSTSVYGAKLDRSHKRFTDLRTTFASNATLTGNFDLHRELTGWSAQLLMYHSEKTFEQTATHGFAFSLTQVHFRQRLALFDSNQFQQASAQSLLFPDINYSHCSLSRCQAHQKVGALLPDAYYLSHFKLLKVSSREEVMALKIPPKLLSDTDHFPKFIILQLGTDWSNYFHRANSISVFEPDPNDADWIKIKTYQTLSLNAIGAMGKGSIKTVLEGQINSFLIAFGKL